MKVKFINDARYGPAEKGEFVGEVFEVNDISQGFCTIRDGEFVKQGVIFSKEKHDADYLWNFPPWSFEIVGEES